MLSFLRMSFLLLCLNLHVLAAPEDVPVEHYEKSVAGSDFGRHYYGVRLQFPGKDAWKDILEKDNTQLASVAKDGYIRMSQADQYIAKGRRAFVPYVMTALAVGDSIYVGSSMKGPGNGFLYDEKNDGNPIYKTLEECAQALKKYGGKEAKDVHANKASCGEITSLLMYYKENNGLNLEKLAGAKIVTVRSKTTRKVALAKADPASIVVFDPCGTDAEPINNIRPLDQDPPKITIFGCFQVLQNLKVDPIMDDTTKFGAYNFGSGVKSKKVDLFACSAPQAGSSKGKGKAS